MVLDNYAAGQSWVDLTTYKDPAGFSKFYGVFYRVNVKSLVWYSPDNFEDNGYEIPTTMEGLLALADQMVSDEIHLSVLVWDPVVPLGGQLLIGWKT